MAQVGNTLYKKTQIGKIQEWSIFQEDGCFWTVSGQVNGKLVKSEPTRCFAKNVGRKNETTAEQQAELEALAKWKKKSETGYGLSMEDAGRPAYIEPTLAKDYEDYKDELAFPVLSDRKYNGMRCVVNKHGMRSRNGKEIVSAPHIFELLKPVFEEYPDAVFDGELYSHELRHKLNRIIELVRRTKPSDADLILSEHTVEYHVYDGYNFGDGATEQDNFTARKQAIRKLIRMIRSPKIVYVQSDVANDQLELDRLYKQYLEEEYEGQMIRQDGPYEHKRTKRLLKRKTFQDAEFLVIDITEGTGNRTGTAGYATCQLDTGETFRSNIKGDFEYITQVLKDKDQYIGKNATVKFFEYTEYGVPQFPYIVAFDPPDR